MIETFAALAEPNRLRIVELLQAGPRAVLDINHRLGLSQPQVSKHLRVLRQAGMVEAEIRAQQRLYRLRPEPMLRLREWLETYRSLWDERFEELEEIVRSVAEKPKINARKKGR